MNPFRCRIAAINTHPLFEGQLTVQYDSERLTLPVRPLSLFLPWIRSWKVGDELVCHVNENHSCGFANGTSFIDPLPVDDTAYNILREWASGRAGVRPDAR
ncbi:MAG TPA: hypothetical protein VE077_11605 [Candidatus Methylomirabilis sp.]|nr:hypothetical protein [Candidatus Methylomirabilis sp.]